MFVDRVDAGRRLAVPLLERAYQDPLVLALPRGGVPVGREVAVALGAPLDVLIVRKLGVPWHTEYAFGALGEGGVVVIDEEVVRQLRMDRAEVEQVVAAKTGEIERRVAQYRAGRSPEPVAGRTAILVDDGLATGSTMAAAVQVVDRAGAESVVVAVPVASPRALDRIAAMVDEVVCLQAPEGFQAVGQFYSDFDQLADAQVVAAMAEHRAESAPRTHAATSPPAPVDTAAAAGASCDAEVVIPVDGVKLRGHLTVPRSARGIVVFAHGSGSSRHSPRNQYVARVLSDAGLGTLLFDLLTGVEAGDRGNVLNIDMLGRRLAGAVQWLTDQPVGHGRVVGTFGASTGAAAALVAAARLPQLVRSVVSRGGRPDLAGRLLRRVTAPTLLIVGDRDYQVIELNRAAAAELAGPHELVLVPVAGHLFEESGTLERVAELARDFFLATLQEPSV